MDPAPAAKEGGRDPRFPPMVRFAVFLDAVKTLSDSEDRQRQEFLGGLSDNDRSQLLRALDLFRLRGQSGRYNEIGLRRLADPKHRSAALAELLRGHFGDELQAIRAGVTRDQLEGMLAVPGRASASAREKARQFLERAMEEAGLRTEGIQAGGRSARITRGPSRGVETYVDEVRLRYVRQQQQYLDQLLVRHNEAGDTEEARRLEAAIESVSERLDRYLSSP